MNSVDAVSIVYKTAMTNFVAAIEAGADVGTLTPAEREAAEALAEAGKEVVGLRVRTTADVVAAIDLLRFAVETMAVYPRPAELLADKIHRALRPLVRDADARRRKGVAR